MRKILLVISAVVVLSSVVFAEGAAKAGQFAIQTAIVATSTPLSPDVGVKLMVSDNIALMASFGFHMVPVPNSHDSSTAYDFVACFDYEFTSRGGVSPYVGLEGNFGGVYDTTGVNSSTYWAARLVVGGEFFFSSNFSLSAEIGPGLSGTGTSGGAIDAGTFVRMLFSWYLN